MTPYRRKMMMLEKSWQWHMNDAKSLPPTRYFTERQFIEAVAGAFLAGAAFTALSLFLLTMEG